MNYQDEMSNMDKNISIIESILDDYLDEMGPVFSFEIKNIKEDIFLSIKPPQRSNDPLRDWGGSICPIVKNFHMYYRSTRYSSGEYKKKAIEEINNTDPFQKIYKLTGFKLSYFLGKDLVTTTNPHMELKLSPSESNLSFLRPYKEFKNENLGIDDSEQNISIIEAILDDYLDEMGPVLSFTFEDPKNLLKKDGVVLLIDVQKLVDNWDNSPCPIVQTLCDYYSNVDTRDPIKQNHKLNNAINNINNTNPFQKIFKLTGLNIRKFSVLISHIKFELSIPLNINEHLSVVNKNLSTIEAILDDYLDEMGTVFSFDVGDPKNYVSGPARPRGDVILLIDIPGEWTRWNNSPCPIVQILFNYYDTLDSHYTKRKHNKALSDINNTDPFQKIYKLTGLKLCAFSASSGSMKFELSIPLNKINEHLNENTISGDSLISTFTKFNEHVNNNRVSISDIEKKAEIVETILDDYLDEVNHAFSFELSVYHCLIILSIYYNNWNTIDSCSIVRSLSTYYKNKESRFAIVPQIKTIQEIKNTLPFQKIYKLTGLELSAFNSIFVPPDPHIDLILRLE